MIAYGKHLRVSFSNTKEDGAGREGEDEFQVADPVRDLHNSETAISMCLGINAKRQEYTHGKRWRIVTKKHNFLILYDDVYIYYLLFLYTSKLRLKHCFFSFSGFAGCEPASLVVLSFWKNSTWHFLQTFSSVNMGYGIGHLRLSEYIENYMAGKLRIIERTSFFWKENSWEFSWRWDMSHFKRLVVKEQIHSEVWKQTCEH